MTFPDVAELLIRRAGFASDAIPAAVAARVALETYGDDCLVFLRDHPVEASVATVMGRKRIVVRARMHPRRTHFAIARMVARIELTKLGAWNHENENTLAAELTQPREMFVPELGRVGLSLHDLATRFAVPETSCAIRVVEVGARDGVVVTPERVYRRGTPMAWLPDDEVRKLAEARSPRSVRKAPIADLPGRVALYRAA